MTADLARAIEALKPGVPDADYTVHQVVIYQNGFRAAIAQVLELVGGEHPPFAEPAGQHNATAAGAA